MKNVLLTAARGTIILLGAAIFCCCQNLQAQAPVIPPPFSGSISFSGAATLDAPLGSATKFNSIFGIGGPTTSPEVIFGATGGYSNILVGTPATFTPFTFNPSSSVGTFQLWTLMYASVTYSFEVTSETTYMQNSSFLNLGGSGIAFVGGNEYDDATWSITDTGSSSTLTFGSGVTVVPEPASSVIMLGGLAALYCFFRFRRAVRG